MLQKLKLKLGDKVYTDWSAVREYIEKLQSGHTEYRGLLLEQLSGFAREMIERRYYFWDWDLKQDLFVYILEEILILIDKNKLSSKKGNIPKFLRRHLRFLCRRYAAINGSLVWVNSNFYLSSEDLYECVNSHFHAETNIESYLIWKESVEKANLIMLAVKYFFRARSKAEREALEYVLNYRVVLGEFPPRWYIRLRFRVDEKTSEFYINYVKLHLNFVQDKLAGANLYFSEDWKVDDKLRSMITRRDIPVITIYRNEQHA